MAEDTPQSTAVSVAKFNQLIVKALTEGPKRIKEIYTFALAHQSQDCPDIPCPHRKKANKSMEWQHEIQRQLARIASNTDGLWNLKSTVVASQEPVPEEPPHDDLPVAPVVPAAPYTGDPFMIVSTAEEMPPYATPGVSHFMDVEELKKPAGKRFIVPMDFDEFYAWKQDYVLNWAKKRLSRFVVDDEVEDWTQDLLIHLRYLPQGSKHRTPGANGRVRGCQDVIETFNPIQQYGASERRFRNYINSILANKFLTVQSKRQKNPVLRPGNIPFGVGSDEHEAEYTAGDEFVHANSDFLSGRSQTAAKQHDDRLYTNEFKQFVMEADPSVYSAFEALESTGTIGEAAKFLGLPDSEFTRFRNRLKQLAECFTKGLPVPKQRRPYKKRAKAAAAGDGTTV